MQNRHRSQNVFLECINSVLSVQKFWTVSCMLTFNGGFLLHGHKSFDPISLKTLCSLSPPPVMLHIKFDQVWPTGLRDIQVKMCKISPFKSK